MQSLDSSQEPCKEQISFTRNELFRSSKILVYQVTESSQSKIEGECGGSGPTSLNFFEETLVKPGYETKEESLAEVEASPGNRSSRTLDEDYKRSQVTSKGMRSLQGSNSEAGGKVYSIGTGTSSSGADERDAKFAGRRKKVGDIVSTSRSGHLIERKDESYSSAIKKVDTGDASEGCDTNDNIINTEVLNSDAFDVNDNPSEEGNVQREEETSLSENGQSGRSDCETPCEISLLERLIRSHPVWFLRGIQRAGAVHLLQGKEEGNFIVRQSSQKDTMAVSVRLPPGKGPYIEHYLIQRVDGQLSLESSENMFESIPSLIAHYCQCCDELPVRLTLPATIRDAKNRQQLSSLALLGQEFWRYPMANPRPPESQNSSPSSHKTDSLCSSDGGKKFRGKDNEEIVLDLTPLNQDSPHSSLLSTFKSPQVEGVSSSSAVEVKPKRPHTLDLVTTNTDKTGLLNGNKTPPQPPPRWTKPLPMISPKQPSFPEVIRTTTTPVFEEDLKSFPLFSTGAFEYDHNMSSPQSDQTNLKSFNFKCDKNSLKLFRDENKLELISPVSDNTNFISKSLEKTQQQQFDSVRSDKSERVSKRYKKDWKLRESAHYQESDILESPTLYYYKNSVADKQSDYEDIWGAESFTTFKPGNANDQDGSRMVPENKTDAKKPPDLLDKLDTSFRMSFKEKKEEKCVGKQEEYRADPTRSFDSQVVEQFDAKQSSPFYAEPADALVVRRKEKMSFNKSRHSDPFSFNNWSVHMNPYFSGGNILGRIDSQNEVSDDNWRTKPSLSFDNIINLKRRETEAKAKANTKGKAVVKAKPVRPPKIYNFPLDKGPQNWAVDSSWEFIGNETAEKEGERRFPSIEQQMDSEEAAAYKDTVQEMIAKRFPHFKIFRGFWNKNVGNRDVTSSCHQMHLQKLDPSKNGSRISAYDNLTCERFNVFKSGNESGQSGDSNCDTSSSPCSITYDQHAKSTAEPENSFPLKSLVLADTLRYKRRLECGSLTEDNEDAQTIFSEPWDSSRWENLLPPAKEPSFESVNQVEAVFSADIPENSFDPSQQVGKTAKRKIYSEGLDLPMSFQQTIPKSKELSATGASIRSYALHLASDKSTTFAQNIDNFIACTLESKEANPQVVMRNMRQFMSGMKNYLVKHGEREFEKQVEEERMKLKSTEFLNLDSILEGVMHKLVVRPLREHLYKLFVDEYVRNGAIQLLYDNLSYARTKSLRDLGLKSKISPPSQDALERICHFITKLQEVDSPLEKLDNLLTCVSTIIYFVKLANQGRPGITFGADDILPLFIWVLVQSGFIAAEIEAEYMWGLLHPSLLSGEGCYYLTTLSSAVHVLKNLKACDLDQPNRSTMNEWHCGDLKSVLKIIVPDELHGSILTKTLPVKPNMTTKDVCKIIAHKIRITNPQDYGLFRLVDGEETLLNDTECPQDVKSQFVESGKHCTLAYKRIDAKIGWPRTT